MYFEEVADAKLYMNVVCLALRCSRYIADMLSWPRCQWYKLVISLGVFLYVLYIASGLWLSVYKSHRDLHLVIYI